MSNLLAVNNLSIKFKAKDVIDIMATSVFFYIEEVFIKKRKDTN